MSPWLAWTSHGLAWLRLWWFLVVTALLDIVINHGGRERGVSMSLADFDKFTWARASLKIILFPVHPPGDPISAEWFFFLLGFRFFSPFFLSIFIVFYYIKRNI